MIRILLALSKISGIADAFIKYYAGYEVVIHNKIDPKIIGGYHILVNGVSIDLSIKRKIDDLQKHILN